MGTEERWAQRNSGHRGTAWGAQRNSRHRGTVGTETVVPAGYVLTILQDDNNEETLRKKSGLLNLLYRTLYSLFVFQLAKRLQLTVDTYKLVSYLSQIND